MRIIKALICLLTLSAIQAARAQADSTQIAENNSVLAYYQRYRAFEYYLAPAADNQLFMKVNVWGEVQKPGVLEVPDRTDLLSALSIAGGTKDRAKLSKVKVIRGFNGEKRSWEVNLKKAIKNGNLEQVPVLQPGDTVVVPKSGFNIFSKFLTVAYNVAVIVTASALLLN